MFVFRGFFSNSSEMEINQTADGGVGGETRMQREKRVFFTTAKETALEGGILAKPIADVAAEMHWEKGIRCVKHIEEKVEKEKFGELLQMGMEGFLTPEHVETYLKHLQEGRSQRNNRFSGETLMVAYRSFRLLFRILADKVTHESYSPRLLKHCKSIRKKLNSLERREGTAPKGSRCPKRGYGSKVRSRLFPVLRARDLRRISSDVQARWI